MFMCTCMYIQARAICHMEYFFMHITDVLCGKKGRVQTRAKGQGRESMQLMKAECKIA